MAEELIWGYASDGRVLNLDGSLSAGWRVRCPDYSSTSEEELAQIARVVNEALNPLSDRWLIDFNVLRFRSPGYPDSGDFPDAVTAAVDQERATRFQGSQNWLSEQVLVVTYSPPQDVYEQAAAFFVEHCGPTHSDRWQREVDIFHEQIARVQVVLDREFGLERLDTDALASHLRSCLTGQRETVRVPEHGMALRDLLVGGGELVGGFEPQLGDYHLRMLAVTGYPSSPRLDGFEVFHSFTFPIRSSSRIFVLGRRAGAALIGAQRVSWFNRSISWQKGSSSVFSNTHATEMAQDAAGAIAESSAGELYAAYTWTLVLSAKDRTVLEDRVAEVVEAFSSRGFVVVRETVNAPAAFLGSLPGHGRHNLRLPVLPLRGVSTLLGTTSPHLGAESCPSSLYPKDSPPVAWALTEGSTPYRLHLTHGDTPHWLVVGKTRSGKSVFLLFLAIQALRFRRSQVFLLDVDHSAAFTALAAGGVHYDIGGEMQLAFQPLADLESEEAFEWAVGWLLDILRIQGVGTGPEIQRDLEAGLGLLRAEAQAHRTLSLLRDYVQLKETKSALRAYTGDGRYARYLDGDEDAMRVGRFQVFELGRLLQDGSEGISVPILLLIFRKIEQRLDGSPSLIIVEEAWLPLLSDEFAARIQFWLRRLAKRNCGVALVTQSPEEVLESRYAKMILDACASRLFLPDPQAETPRGRQLYRDLGLNPKEIGLLAGARERQDYLHNTPEGSRLIELGLGELALALLTPRRGRGVHKMFEEALGRRSADGAEWFVEYLRSQGLADWAEILREGKAA